MAGAELWLEPGLLDAVQGKEPEKWGTELTPVALNQGLDAAPGSDNKIALDAGHWAQAEARGWHIPEPMSNRSAFDWWSQELDRQLDGGQFMADELGTRLSYGLWTPAGFGAARDAAVRMGFRDNGGLVAKFDRWLRTYFGLVALSYQLGEAPRRYMPGEDFSRVAICGARGFVTKGPGGRPRLVDDNPLAKFMDHHIGAKRWRKEWLVQIYEHCGQFGLPKDLEAGIDWSVRTKQPFRIIRWVDGAVLWVLLSAEHLSGATAPLYAIFLPPGSKCRVLYGDSGRRGQGDVVRGKVRATRDGSRILLDLLRTGVRDQPRRPEDEGEFIDTDNVRRMLIDHPSKILDDRIFGDGAVTSTRPADPPKPPEPPQPPQPPDDPPTTSSDVEIGWAKKIRGQNSGSNNDLYHAACVAILLHQQASRGNDDLSPLAGHAKQLARILR